jgi:hypothetical protein
MMGMKSDGDIKGFRGRYGFGARGVSRELHYYYSVPPLVSALQGPADCDIKISSP